MMAPEIIDLLMAYPWIGADSFAALAKVTKHHASQDLHRAHKKGFLLARKESKKDSRKRGRPCFLYSVSSKGFKYRQWIEKARKGRIHAPSEILDPVDRERIEKDAGPATIDQENSVTKRIFDAIGSAARRKIRRIRIVPRERNGKIIFDESGTPLADFVVEPPVYVTDFLPVSIPKELLAYLVLRKKDGCTREELLFEFDYFCATTFISIKDRYFILFKLLQMEFF